MNDEIKEILNDNDELLVRYKDNSFESFDTLPINVLDYIINLQQENERLRHQLEVQRDLTIKNRLRKHIYKTRCEKASEYINDMLYPIGTCVNGSDLPYESIESLLNILQNGSDDNE